MLFRSSGTLSVQTSEDNIRLNGAIFLQSNVALDTDEGAAATPTAGAGNVFFTSAATLNSQDGTISDGTISLVAKASGYVMKSDARFDEKTMDLKSAISMGSNPAPVMTFDAKLFR